jgi:hypothetical protein
VVGVLGLVTLIASVGVMAYSVVLRPLSPAFARHLKNPSVIIGGVVAMAIFAITHEVLHFRYVWGFLGILAGLYLFGREVPPRGLADPVVGGSGKGAGWSSEPMVRMTLYGTDRRPRTRSYRRRRALSPGSALASLEEASGEGEPQHEEPVREAR